MSGDPPTRVDLLGAELVRLISAIDPLLSASDGSSLVVVGGLAVACRCRTMTRATADVDTVSDARGPFEVVRGLDDGAFAGGGRPQPGHQVEEELEVDGRTVVVTLADGKLKVDGVSVDVIDTYDLSGVDFDEYEDREQLFLGAHRWALESAGPLTVRVTGPPGGAFAGPVTAELLVAAPAALVAMKLASLSGRPSHSPKRASDSEDLYRLLDEHDNAGEVSRAIADAPFGLGRVCLEVAQDVLVAQRLTRLRELTSMGGTPIPGDAYGLVIDEFVHGLRSRLGAG